MRHLFSLILVGFIILPSSAQIQKANQSNRSNSKPKLVVGIVVDQMRYDYLTRFENRYGQDGFMRLINKGFNCKNNHYNYIPTYTGPGHASVYTGTTPKMHGIISNSWYDKVEKKSVYCSGDDSVLPIGTASSAGKMSPHRMKTTTFADENKLFTQNRGKTIGISIKDRGAILTAGHSADAAYWFVGSAEGNFVSSSYYMEKLPNWVNRFNSSDAVENYMTEWNTLENIETYEESGDDLNTFEGGFLGKEEATFPYDLKALSNMNGNFDIIRSTPFGNSIVTDFAIEALKNEDLGKDDHTDVLAISYSSTDYVGHNFGVNSKEIQDTYMRLDMEIAKLLKELDREVGIGNYTVFLTSDHGAVHVPNYLKSMKIPAGYFETGNSRTEFLQFLRTEFGSQELVESISNNQIFLNHNKLREMRLDKAEVCDKILTKILSFDFIDKAYLGTDLSRMVYTEGIEKLLQNGYHQKRSGDVLYVPNPAHISYSQTGSTHGSGLNYDTHVPLIFYGNGIANGSTLQRTNIPDIAPTISALLGISFPNGATGKVLDFVID